MDFECAFQPELLELHSSPALTIHARPKVSAIPLLFSHGYASILQLLTEHGKKPGGPPFALYYNMDMEDLEVEFGFPVDEPFEGSGSIHAAGTPSRTPAARAVTTLYIGPYEEIEPAYDFLLKWSDDNHLTLSGVSYEIYLNDQADTSPDMLKTQLHLLLLEE